MSIRMSILFLALMLPLCLAACGGGGSSRQSENVPTPSAPEKVQGSETADASNPLPSEEAEGFVQGGVDKRIYITTGDGNEIVFQLNASPAADAFYRQLPLSVSVEDYAGSEKIFYPPEALDTGDTPAAQGPAGTLAYYEPWGNIAIFYGECGGADGLYGLGRAVSGTEFIAGMTGEVKIDSNPAVREAANDINFEENGAMKMNVQAGDSTFTATLEENAAVEAFTALMEDAPVVIRMRDYSGFEKTGALGAELPADNTRTTAQPGDIVLYNGNQIVIFYGSNSWSYTRLGKIDDLTGWEDALGSGDVTVTFSLK